MANPSQSLIHGQLPPGLVSSRTGTGGNQNPNFTEINYLAQQILASQSPLSSAAPASWPYGPATHQSADDPSQVYWVMAGPGLMVPMHMLQPYGHPSLMPRPGQLPPAPLQLPPASNVLERARAIGSVPLPAVSPQQHRVPPSPLPAESPTPPPVSHPPAPPPLPQARPSPLPAEDDASSVIPSHFFSAQEPGRVDGEDDWESRLKEVKEWAEKKALESKECRKLLCSKAVCIQCNPPEALASWEVMRDHSRARHDGRIRCWHRGCRKEENTIPIDDFYQHFPVHGCGQILNICGDCAKNGKRVQPFARFSTLRKHLRRFHTSPTEKYYRVDAKLVDVTTSAVESTVVYLFNEMPSEATLDLLCGNRKDELIQRMGNVSMYLSEGRGEEIMGDFKKRVDI